MLYLILLLQCVGVTVLGSTLPAGVKLCHRSDANFQKCLAKNIPDGIKLFLDGNKELGVPQLEPFFIPKIEIKGGSGSSVSLDQKYENVKVYGTLSDMSIPNYHKLSLDKECVWEFDTINPLAKMEADYEIKGQLLVFPINARGKCTVTQHKLENKNRAKCEIYTKDNEKYLRLTNYSMNMSVEKVDFYFENILPGDEKISDSILKAMNENDIQVFNEIKTGFEKVFSVIYMDVVNKVFSKVPLKDIFPD